MIPTLMIVAGMMMMVWPCRRADALDENIVGHPLREAFGRAVREPIPAEIDEVQGRVERALRILRANP